MRRLGPAAQLHHEVGHAAPTAGEQLRNAVPSVRRTHARGGSAQGPVQRNPELHTDHPEPSSLEKGVVHARLPQGPWLPLRTGPRAPAGQASENRQKRRQAVVQPRRLGVLPQHRCSAPGQELHRQHPQVGLESRQGRDLLQNHPTVPQGGTRPHGRHQRVQRGRGCWEHVLRAAGGTGHSGRRKLPGVRQQAVLHQGICVQPLHVGHVQPGVGSSVG